MNWFSLLVLYYLFSMLSLYFILSGKFKKMLDLFIFSFVFGVNMFGYWYIVIKYFYECTEYFLIVYVSGLVVTWLFVNEQKGK